MHQVTMINAVECYKWNIFILRYDACVQFIMLTILLVIIIRCKHDWKMKSEISENGRILRDDETV